MLSHDFARALLARRNHDLKFLTEVSMPGRDDEPGELDSVRLADDRAREVGCEPPEDIFRYDGENDFLEVALGPIYAGRAGEYTLSAEELEMVIRSVTKKIWAIDHIGNYPEESKRYQAFLARLRAAKA